MKDSTMFDDVVQVLRREGLDGDAGRLDDLLNHVAWTSSSELLGEISMALEAARRRVPAGSDARRAIDGALREAARALAGREVR
jgi:hypothetical protein